MKDIDFLPLQYRQARRRHDSRIVRGWLAVIALCAMGVWFGVGRFQLREAKARLIHLDVQNRTVQTGLDLIDKLEGEQTTLLERYGLAQQLTPTLSCVQTLAKLAELIPPQVALERLSIVSRKDQNRPRPGGKLGELAERISADAWQPGITELQLSIVGLAPSEMDVVLLVGRLSSCQSFAEVRLEYCKSDTVNKHRAWVFKVNLLAKAAPLALTHNEDTPSLEALD